MKRFLSYLLFIPFVFACIPASDDKPEEKEEIVVVKPELNRFYKGSTMSFASYGQDLGLVYREDGHVKDPYLSLKEHGGNIVRLQLDQVPFADYGGARIDWQGWERVLADMLHAKKLGLEVMLTLKPDYDIFSDKGSAHNNLPEAWAGKSENEIGELLFNWVYETLMNLHEAGADPSVVAVGNEVNIGFLKPSVGSNDAERTGRLLKRGFAAVRQYAKSSGNRCASLLHIADLSKVETFVSKVESAGAIDYDIIGVSYYPGRNIGHKSWSWTEFASIMERAKGRFGKPLMILETAHSFTTGIKNGKWMGDWCNNAYNYPDWDEALNAVNYTPAKQRDWLKTMAEQIKRAHGVGLITWGSESLPDELEGKEQGHGKGLYTYPAAWGYGSTWENNSYWDFTDGNNLHEGIDWMSDIDETLL